MKSFVRFFGLGLLAACAQDNLNGVPSDDPGGTEQEPSNGDYLSGLVVSAVHSNSCLLIDGTSFCWGSDLSDQLGQDSPSPYLSSSPVQIVGLTSDIDQLAAGGAPCAIRNGALFPLSRSRHKPIIPHARGSPVRSGRQHARPHFGYARDLAAHFAQFSRHDELRN